MKKHIIFCGAMLSLLSFAACTEVDDYSDWADLSTNDSEAAMAAYGIDIVGSGIEIDMSANPLKDSIDVATIFYSNPDIVEAGFKDIKINGCKIPYNIKGNDARIGVNALDSLAQTALQSRKCEKRALTVKVDAYAKLKSGEAVSFTKELIQYETPIPTPEIDPDGYYLLGDLAENGAGWDITTPVNMTKVSDGVYSVNVTTTGDSNWFKFYGTSHWSPVSWDVVNQSQLGCAVNGDDATFNFVEWNNVQTPVITGAGKWKVTLDVNNWTYTISPIFQ